MHSKTVRTEELTLDVQQKIDVCCDQFEQQLQAGSAPTIAEYLERVPSSAQDVLRREFAAIELAYQRTQPHRDSEALHLRCPHCQNQVELLADAELQDITCNSCGDTFSLIDDDSDTSEASAHERIAHFELLHRLGMGGFGSVWEARDTQLDRLVALKLPRKSQLSAREAEQFFREARAAAQLKHPHIVPVHEVGRDGDHVFIVTDLIRGVPMSEWLKEIRPTFIESAKLCATIADALAYAHSRGVIHRDLKPSNIMYGHDDQPHIMDFGLAKRELGEITMTIDGTVLGTPAYMSPEQALGETHWVDRRTDIYSLGVMLFQMLTGELPYRGTAQQQIQQRIVDDAPSPRKLNSHIPVDLATICLKCLERNATRRFETATEFAAELRRYLAGEPIKSRPISNLERTLRWAQRNRALATAAGLTMVLAIAGPLTAARMFRDKQRIQAQNVENSRLIERAIVERDELTRQLGEAKTTLDGMKRVKPEEVELTSWRDQLAKQIIGKRQQQREKALSIDPETANRDELAVAARENLGWFYLLQASKKHQFASEHLSRAVECLRELSVEESGNQKVNLALADLLQLLSANHSGLRNDEKATELANDAFKMRKQISEKNPEQISYLLEKYDAGLQYFQLKNLDKNELRQLQQLKEEIAESVSGNDVDWYTLACFLTRHDPSLLGDLAPVTTSQTFKDSQIE